MRKKYLSALLFGALLFASAGTFTSCKDYDDDINNLQGQIDENEASLTEKLAAVESSISSLQSAQSAMQAAIDAAQQAADDAAAAAAQAEANAIAAATEQLESVKAELTELINQGDNALQSDIDAVNATIATINGQIETLTAAVGQNTEAVAALQEANTNLTQSIAALDEQVKANATAIGNLQAGLQTQADALKAYQESNDADVAGALADIEELQAKIAELAGSEDLGTLQEQIDAIKAECQTVSDEVDRINSDINTLFYAWYEGVTGVSLIASTVNQDYNAQNIALLSAEAIANNTFGEELKDNDLFGAIAGAPMTFEAGERTKLEASFLMRVFPTTAVPQKSDIKLINSDGEDLVSTGQVEVVSVEKNTETLTRAAANTGLWKVTLKVGAKYTDKDFDAMTTRVKGSKVEYPLFAVAIEDSRANVEGALRSVVSEYNLTFANNAEGAKDELAFTVNDINVDRIYNRATYNREVINGATDVLPTEYVWANGAQAKPNWEGGLKNVVEGDDRSKPIYNYLEVTSKDAITIQLDDELLKSAVAYYIVMDKNCAVSSDESEIRAWNSIESSIDGINKMYYTNTDKGEATITFTEDVNDIIGFRVYAVNANGTLVDPDGRSFYVKVGKSAQATASVNATVVPFITEPWKAQVIAEIQNLDAIKELLDANKQYTIEYAIDDVFEYDLNDPNSGVSRGNAFRWTMINKDGNATRVTNGNTWREDATTGVATTAAFTGAEFAKVANIRLYLNDFAQWIDYTDGKTYTGKLTIKDSNNNSVATIDLAFAKTLPTDLPEGFGWKVAQQDENGVYACYLEPNSWNANTATAGTRNLNEIFNFGEVGVTYEVVDYTITFYTKDGAETENTFDGILNANSTITIDKESIDNSTQYDAVVSYNYGKISSVNPTTDFIIENTYKVTYNCYLDSQYSWKLNTNTWSGEVTYGNPVTIDIAAAIDGKSTYDGKYSKTLAEWITDGSISIKDVKLTSNATGAEDYYEAVVRGGEIHLTVKANASNPVADVPSTLSITTVDMYGHENVIKIENITVKKR